MNASVMNDCQMHGACSQSNRDQMAGVDQATGGSYHANSCTTVDSLPQLVATWSPPRGWVLFPITSPHIHSGKQLLHPVLAFGFALCLALQRLPVNDTWLLAGRDWASAGRDVLDDLGLSGGNTATAIKQLSHLTQVRGQRPAEWAWGALTHVFA